MTPEQLKASILQYAVEGKLVKQDPNDEPASELLKKIENEKDQLIEEGKIKRSRKLSAITDEEKPFDIPKNWTYGRLKQITTFGNFDSVKGTSIPDNSWVVDMKDVRKDGGGFLAIVRKKSTDIYKSNKYSFSKNAVLYGKLRPYLRKVEVAKADGFTTTEMFPINVVDINTLIPQYLRYVMLSPYFVDLVNDSMYGMKMPRVDTTFLAKMVIPLPPLEEQKRIVAKIEKLMPLVDEYAESYNRLQKIDNEFEDKLKQSVLQYAMEGKLVKQNPSDEPASELIKKIENEKAELVKEGKIKKSKKLPAITDDEKPFDIPNSWEWVRLGDIVQAQIGKTPKRHNSDYWAERDIPWVSISDLTNGNLTETKEKISSKALKDVFHDRIVAKNTLLMSFKLTIGKVAILRINAVHNEAIVSIIPFIDSEHSLRDYLFVTLPMISQNGDFKDAIKGKTLNKSSLTKLLIPLPPLKEQKRIVAKLREFKRSADILSK
ncbi:restriction endonuclease subunit S [Lactobacillus amylovorus]|uniref:restriction endonuclease subunit S n=1 Tax=Lactobacillus amylovorus TaxID=1604 RepID=UPI0021A89022|nr:restriction endonuclease subunit S [Lactobacillus amylovorus]MCT3599454.1 restriction endonuclease subunit S [Lactobacillus amylovorus]